MKFPAQVENRQPQAEACPQSNLIPLGHPLAEPAMIQRSMVAWIPFLVGHFEVGPLCTAMLILSDEPVLIQRRSTVVSVPFPGRSEAGHLYAVALLVLSKFLGDRAMLLSAGFLGARQDLRKHVASHPMLLEASSGN
jgi:hypothetical protein